MLSIKFSSIKLNIHIRIVLSNRKLTKKTLLKTNIKNDAKYKRTAQEI